MSRLRCCCHGFKHREPLFKQSRRRMHAHGGLGGLKGSDPSLKQSSGTGLGRSDPLLEGSEALTEGLHRPHDGCQLCRHLVRRDCGRLPHDTHLKRHGSMDCICLRPWSY